MADLRIVDAPLLSTVKGTEKIPTGGEGNFSISVNQVADFAKLKWVLATEGYVVNAVGNVQADLNLHKNNSNNPHGVTKAQVGLGNVDNTADVDKPIGSATQAALATLTQTKADKTYVDTQLSNKADKSTTYSKMETDSLVSAKSDTTYVNTKYSSHIKTFLNTGAALSNTVNGEYFFVISNDSEKVEDLYLNVNGVATNQNKSEISSLLQHNSILGRDVTGAHQATSISTASGVTQQQINDFGGAKWYAKVGGYELGATVKLENGNIVKSTVANNTTDPNQDMTGWALTGNTLTFETALELPEGVSEGDVAFVKDTATIYIKTESGWTLKSKRTANISDFPKYAPEIDDSGRFLRLADYVNSSLTEEAVTGGYRTVTAFGVIISSGIYTISQEINFNGFVSIISDAQAIIKQTAVLRTFVFDMTENPTYQPIISGIRFVWGTTALYFSNENLDTTRISVQDCAFYGQSVVSIDTFGTIRADDPHMSCIIDINRCLFLAPKKAFRNVCDKAIIRNSWLYPTRYNFDADSAFIVNQEGVLTLDNCVGVPVIGTGAEHVQYSRWVDNYGSMIVDKCRFGLEENGLPFIYSFGGEWTAPDGRMTSYGYPSPATSGEGQGSYILIKNSHICSGLSYEHPDAGVVVLRQYLPQQIVIEDNNFILESPYIAVHPDYTTFNTYLDSVIDQNAEKLMSKYKYRIDYNMELQNNTQLYPLKLGMFINHGTGIEKNLPLVPFSKSVSSSSSSYFTYLIPRWTHNFAYLVTVSGNFAPSGNNAYRIEQTFLLKMQTAYSESIGSVVRFLAHANIGDTAVPASINYIGAISLDYFFGSGTSGDKIKQIQDKEFFTLKIDGIFQTADSKIEVKMVRLSNY